MSAALLEKVARLSSAQLRSADAALEQAHALRLRAEELVEADANAYLSFVEALRAAKGLRGSARERSVKPARDVTVDVPLAIVRLAAETVELARELAANGNPNLRADAMVAATLASAASTAAARLIAVNLSGAGGDRRLAEAKRIAADTSDAAEAVARPQAP
jgi:methenyltetrahydrofolate cyclohydrolase